MRITHVITRLIVGGAQENTVASVIGLSRKPGLTVDLISGPTSGPEGSLECNLEPAASDPTNRQTSQILFTLPELVRPVHPFKDWVALRKLTKRFKQTRPDIVHTHSGKAGFLGRIAASRAGVPIIIHTIHGPSFGNFQSSLSNRMFLSAERRAGKVTSHFVSVADAMTRQYLTAGIGRSEQYTTIYSGFPLEPFVTATNDPQMRALWQIAPEDIVIGKIARLFKLKGHDDLFEIAPDLIRRSPRIKFLVVGDGEWRQRFEKRTRELGLEKQFIFTGLVPPVQIPKLVGIMDALIHLSLREGLPRALPQALAAGKPVVAYDCDGAKEVCRDNETGFLIKPGDRAALTERILQLANDVELRERLGAKGQEFVLERFEVDRMIDELHKLYLKLAGARNLSPK